MHPHDALRRPAPDLRSRPLGALATALALVLVACGGSAGSPGPGSSQGTAATGGNAATGGPAATGPVGGGTATSTPGAGGEAADGCSFLTAADIKAVTTYDVASSTPGPQFGIFPAGCHWELAADTIVPPSIGLGIMTTGGRAYWDTYFAPYNDEEDRKPISGLGDAAVDDIAGAVLVVSGDAFFNVQYIGGGFGGDDTSISEALARKVLPHLGG